MLLCNIIGVFWGLHTTSISGANDTALYTIVSIWNVSIFRLHWVLVIWLLHEYIQPELVNGAVLGGGCSCFYQCNKHNSCYVLYVWYICSGFPAPRARFYAHLPPSSVGTCPSAPPVMSMYLLSSCSLWWRLSPVLWLQPNLHSGFNTTSLYFAPASVWSRVLCVCIICAASCGNSSHLLTPTVCCPESTSHPKMQSLRSPCF